MAIEYQEVEALWDRVAGIEPSPEAKLRIEQHIRSAIKVSMRRWQETNWGKRPQFPRLKFSPSHHSRIRTMGRHHVGYDPKYKGH